MSSFSIDFEWLSREYGDEYARATFAQISISVGGHRATELEDLQTRTVRSGIRVSAFALANWFASNWWRLRWEPRRPGLDWEMSHKIGAAGEGYLWPDISFVSDGGEVLVSARVSPAAPKEPVRYLRDLTVYVSADAFEQGVDAFIEAVTGRLVSSGLARNELAAVWKEVSTERHDPVLTAWRRLEAILGHDPDDAPAELIEGLQRAGSIHGRAAVEEMAAAAGECALEDINALWNGPRESAWPLQVPASDALRAGIEAIEPSLLPWQRAEQAARLARSMWSVEAGPVPNEILSDLLGISHAQIENASSVAGPIDAGFRENGPDSFNCYLRSPYSANRRFALLRLVADHLTAPCDDDLLPATRAETQRQKFQRAFAQEFLCPYAELSGILSSAPSDEDIEDVARHFKVSSLMVKTILLNKARLLGGNAPMYT